LIASSRTRPVSFARAVELLFAAHAPWSFWLVAVGFAQIVTPNQNVAIGSAVVPGIWTAWMLLPFSRDVLGLAPGKSRALVFAHQGVTLLLIAAYVELASRLSVRVIGLLAR
jgi:hypothetical protein